MTQLDTRQDSSGRESARRRGLYLFGTTRHINTRETSTSLAEIEPATPVTKRPQSYALNRAATGSRKLE
jgi:hypothetical protein